MKSRIEGSTEVLPPEHTDPVIIRVDAVIADLVPGYLKARREEMSRLAQAVQEGDLAGLQLMGHRLKGSGAGYGFAEITTLGGAIEDAASSGDMGAVVRAVRRLASYLQVVRLEMP